MRNISDSLPPHQKYILIIPLFNKWFWCGGLLNFAAKSSVPPLGEVKGGLSLVEN